MSKRNRMKRNFRFKVNNGVINEIHFQRVMNEFHHRIKDIDIDNVLQDAFEKVSREDYREESSGDSVRDFIEFVTDEIEKKENYPPCDSIGVIGMNLYADKRRMNLYSIPIFLSEGQSKKNADDYSSFLVEKIADVVNSVLDRNPKTLDEMKQFYKEIEG